MLIDCCIIALWSCSDEDEESGLAAVETTAEILVKEGDAIPLYNVDPSRVSAVRLRLEDSAGYTITDKLRVPPSTKRRPPGTRYAASLFSKRVGGYFNATDHFKT